jgi:hypothetical protein
VREGRVGPIREYGGHEPAVLHQPRATDGIHPSVHAVQIATCHALAHTARTEGERLELPKRDDSMLTLGKLGDPAIDPTILHFRDYLSRFDKRLLHCPQRAATGRARG